MLDEDVGFAKTSGGTGLHVLIPLAGQLTHAESRTLAQLLGQVVVREHPDSATLTFTPCMVVTTPDRKYDVCVAGVCVSPGCGDSTCNAPGPHFPLADTDERTCSDDSTGTIACPAPGQAYYGQDAQYGWDSLHLESERFTRSLSVASQPVVLDNVTGLTWQGCAAGLTGSDCATGQFATYTWQDAVAYCDALDWGGYQDWHLPDPYELDSIVDAGPTGFDITAFPAASKSGNFYWSSSSWAGKSSWAWGGRQLDMGQDIQRICSMRSGKGGTATNPFYPRYLGGNRAGGCR